ncbi:NERD nuclease [Streptomyces venezuelae]|uniref:NERD nuclease n=2 Tax=Streptomyces venezuelae TaxID=54571 RepID=A0A5P2CZD0_STRVZ|nr:NERD nuclease [Streptomyces venezuelae]
MNRLADAGRAPVIPESESPRRRHPSVTGSRQIRPSSSSSCPQPIGARRRLCGGSALDEVGKLLPQGALVAPVVRWSHGADTATAAGGLVDELKVTAWKRYGHDRLYVSLPEGTAVGWMDRRTGEVKVLQAEYAEAITRALGQAVPQATSPVPGPRSGSSSPAIPPLRALAPENDLATNRPGEQLLGKVGPSELGPWGRFVAWLLRRKAAEDSWRTGLVGEQRVGRELERLQRQGWRVLHSIPLPRQVDIDHLLIGHGGVFTINTKRHPQKRVWVGDNAVKVNGGKPHPYPAKSRAEAERARKVLEKHCGFPVPVEGILVFVDVAELNVVPTLSKVRALQERAVSALGPLSGVLTVAQVEHVYSVARDRSVWLDA